MQIVIPMSGFGERFRRAGYTVPKPLIEVDGKPIIEHVVDLFPGEADVLFICNQDHLDDPAFRMEEILTRIRPTGRIIGIAPHKLGPVHAVLQVKAGIDPDRPVIVNYCDFTCYWDYADFKAFVAETACDGAIPAYRGFHPHSLGSTFYAYMRERGGWALDIQEKQPFTDRPMDEYASSGTYYFRSGALMLDAFEQAVAQDLKTGDEFYVSLVYKPLMAAGRPIAVYDLQHFMQWGTPADLEEYVRWSRTFARLAADHREPARQDGTLLIPMAGAGKRFADAGYALPKPLIPVSGRAMAVQAAGDMPRAEHTQFVVRADLPSLRAVVDALKSAFAGAGIVTLDALTDGQARTCLLGMEGIAADRPLSIGACDNGVLFDGGAFNRAMANDGANDGADVLVWGVRGHPEAKRKPEMFGWIAADEKGRIERIAVKQPLDNPARDPIVIGAFTFRRAADFVRAAERMIERAALVNGEYYVDTCVNDAIALGLDCRLFEIDHYLGWGTPNDLRTFEYWQSCFHKWAHHPYRLDKDRRVAPEARADLEARYAATRPARPAPRD